MCPCDLYTPGRVIAPRARRNTSTGPEIFAPASRRRPAAAGADSREVFLIDFGLAKACIRDGVHVAQRVSALDQSARDFRGSAKYASHHTQRGEDVGRRDDLWCWFYSLVYCLEGTLPWEQARVHHHRLMFILFIFLRLRRGLNG